MLGVLNICQYVAKAGGSQFVKDPIRPLRTDRRHLGNNLFASQLFCDYTYILDVDGLSATDGSDFSGADFSQLLQRINKRFDGLTHAFDQ